MTNSDPFAHIHRLRDSRIEAALDAGARHLQAARADITELLSAFRVRELAPGSGLAGGGRGSDVSDPTGNAAIRGDHDTQLRAEFDLTIAELTRALEKLTWFRQRLLHQPTPTGLCRHGACPDKRTATRGVKARDGVPRCEACYKFWLDDVASPMHETEERQERQWRGQTPRRIGYPKQEAVA